MECVVCFEPTEVQTECKHFLCHPCQNSLQKAECPYCRQVIRVWDHQDIKMPFYYFTEVCYEHYRKNVTYHCLKIGSEIPDVLSENNCFIFHNPFHNCPFTENYEKLITVRIFNLTINHRGIKIEFQTRGLDDERNRHYMTIRHGEHNSNWLAYWVRQNKKIRKYWDQAILQFQDSRDGQ